VSASISSYGSAVSQLQAASRGTYGGPSIPERVLKKAYETITGLQRNRRTESVQLVQAQVVGLTVADKLDILDAERPLLLRGHQRRALVQRPQYRKRDIGERDGAGFGDVAGDEYTLAAE